MAVTLLGLTALIAAFAAGVALLLAVGLTWLAGLLPVSLSDSIALAVAAVSTVAVGGVLLRRALREDAAETFDADPVGPAEYPDLHARVTRISQVADLPIPEVCVADRERPIAMTTGLSIDDAQLVLSTGLLSSLDERELDAVVAHELAHVGNRDAAVMTLVEVPLSNARTLGRVLGQSGGVTPWTLVAAAGTYAVWGAGRTLVARLSRARELAADRGATALLGDPSALASALETLADDASTAPELDAREEGLAALSVVPAPPDEPGPSLTYDSCRPLLWGLRLPVRRARRQFTADYVRPLLATHPGTDERIDRLRSLDGDASRR
jgi:heat shock protein HtpX